MKNSRSPAVIGINGPMYSGKTWLIAYLLKAIPDAIVLRPSDELYSIMQEEGSAPARMLYQDFKRLPESRERLIKRAIELRAEDVHVFNRRITASDAYNTSRVVIIDNIGFQDEVSWYDHETGPGKMLMLRIEAQYNEIEPVKSRYRRMKANWPNDLRTPVEYHTMLTAYDSLQLTLLLDWLQRPLTREGAGPYYGIKQLWDQYFAVSASESTAVPNGLGASGQLGGLGEAIGIRPGEFGLRLDF